LDLIGTTRRAATSLWESETPTLKLRDHPLMRYRGISNWPPVWVQESGAKKFSGEIGVLKYVFSRRGPSSKCYLIIEYERETLVGTLLFDNETFCERISSLLRSQVGHTLTKIGDLDVSEAA
jgi:hypothetical protein